MAYTPKLDWDDAPPETPDTSPKAADANRWEQGILDAHQGVDQNAADITALNAAQAAHEADTSNPHEVTKDQVGLGSADNTSDADKPISTAAQDALDLKAAAADTILPRGYITTVVNINDYIGPGVWRISSGATGSTGMPIASTGLLVTHVAVADMHLLQMFHVDNGPVYVRKLRAPAWEPWSLLTGTTGRRNMAGLLTNGWTAAGAGVSLIRTGSQVELFANVTGTSATDPLLLTLPNGFRPAGFKSWFATSGSNPVTSPTPAASWRIRGTGLVEAPVGISNLYLVANFTTDDMWPTTLPGSPA